MKLVRRFPIQWLRATDERWTSVCADLNSLGGSFETIYPNKAEPSAVLSSAFIFRRKYRCENLALPLNVFPPCTRLYQSSGNMPRRKNKAAINIRCQRSCFQRSRG